MVFQSALCNPPSFATFEEYLKYQPGLAPRSRQEYASTIKRFDRVCSELNIEGASRFLTQEPTHQAKAALVHYAKFLKRRDIIIDIREMRVNIRPVKPRDIIEHSDILKVIRYLNIEDKFICLFLLNTGARIHEVFEMHRKDIGESGKNTMVVKGGAYREMWLSDDFLESLRMYLDETKGLLKNDLIFYGHLSSGSRTKSQRFYKRLNERAQKVIGRGIPTHDFRRLVGSYLYSKTKDIEFVRRILGHKSITTTQKYVKYAVGDQDIKKAAQILNELTRQQ